MIDEDVIIKYDITLKEVYEKKAEKDGWLYINLSIESWFFLFPKIWHIWGRNNIICIYANILRILGYLCCADVKWELEKLFIIINKEQKYGASELRVWNYEEQSGGTPAENVGWLKARVVEKG